jgi:hypothetical protein
MNPIMETSLHGIFRDVFIKVYPDVFISDVFVKPSVKDNCLKCDVQVTDTSDRDRPVMIFVELKSCCDSSFSYFRQMTRQMRHPLKERPFEVTDADWIR